MRSRHLLVLAALLAVALLAAACGRGGDQAAQEGDGDGEPEISGDITMARATWDTGFFQAQIYYELLTELGYDVAHPSNKTISAQVFYTALNEGEVDFWANGWFPLHKEFVKDKENIEKVGTQVEAGAFQGYLVDKATAEEHDIKSLRDIAESEELRSLFNFRGDDRADLVGCNAGWGCHEKINQHLKETGMDEQINHVSAEYSALMADVISRYNNDKPVLFYTWTPNWTVAELVPGEDVVWIQAPDHPDDADTVGADRVPGGEKACVATPCDIGWAFNDIRVVANSEFLENNPAAKELFEQVKLSVDRISEQNKRMEEGEDSRQDIANHAQEWIEANREKVDEWLESARDAAAQAQGSS